MSETKPGMPSPALTEDDIRRIVMEMIKQQDTTGDQVECTDIQAEWAKYSPTAD
jgi:hypothetical protein